ncbi:hypothetical protein C7M61_002338 [Candidozyma pseudohaemuli]|uniref:AB hydrolase-1 domain-containing protein n=1 Tax=Candidozyma pseudohaemuli TaxID=418784 RepID=A0A2P7YSW0_9ASCO|nr:hypothetical protein C7M61_002338 [[Candida] pseudohaemulonii]PSK39029.1 hypothetical protein C7M61_002338 [[Candida] pseudohaemulonii]
MAKITLQHGNRTFSAWSSHPQLAITNPRSFERVIFFLHGFPDNNEGYENVTPIVAQHYKKKVLMIAPVMRGYEASSQGPDTEYKMSDLAGDVRAWILLIVPNKEVPVHLVGHDWGAIVTFKTASLYPELITSAVTMAIPYLANLRAWHYLWYAPRQIYCLSYFMTMQYAFLYRQKFGNLQVPGYLDELWSYWSPNWDFSKQIASVRKTLSEPGVLDSATAYYRNLFRPSIIKERKWIVDFEKVPTLILGGDNDNCMVPELYDLEAQLLASTPKVKVQLLSGLGHFMHREDPTKVTELICDWFDKYN